jgi:anti-sigma regulatory factor (Ser/Thr protein kinase)
VEEGAAVRELSLHILDLIENSIRAGVSVVSVTVEEDHAEDLLKISVEDNGRGLQVSPNVAVNPFYTTKSGKRVGLGLSLFRAAAERANGSLTLGKSPLGGLVVTVTMRLSHIDRSPLGDLAATLASVACTNPDIDIRCKLKVDGRESAVSVSEVARKLNFNEFRGLAVARLISEEIKNAMVTLAVSV